MTNSAEMTRHGRKFSRTVDGGWLEVGATLPNTSAAKIMGSAVVFKEAAARFYGGEFRGGTFSGGSFFGGTFLGGSFLGGTFRGGAFSGGTFRGGAFHGGAFHGGDFRDGTFFGGAFHGGRFSGGWFWGGAFLGGEFKDGTFSGGTFHDGLFWGGWFRGGKFFNQPTVVQRSDGHFFTAHFVNDDLRIWAGCRDFSWDEAVAHWSDKHKHGAESQRIISFIKAQAVAAREKGHTNWSSPKHPMVKEATHGIAR